MKYDRVLLHCPSVSGHNRLIAYVWERIMELGFFFILTRTFYFLQPKNVFLGQIVPTEI